MESTQFSDIANYICKFYIVHIIGGGGGYYHVMREPW